MKKSIWLAAGIAGMLLGNPSADTLAEVNVQISVGDRPSFVIDSAPSFIYLRTQGFSISIESPYDIIYYSNRYYLYYRGHWYRSSNYHGPWILVMNNRLPYQIRRHRWEDIRRYRDVEYRRHDSRNNRYQRNDDNKRRVLDLRNEANDRKIRDQKSRKENNLRILDQKKSSDNRRLLNQKKNNDNQRLLDQKKKNDNRNGLGKKNDAETRKDQNEQNREGNNNQDNNGRRN